MTSRYEGKRNPTKNLKLSLEVITLQNLLLEFISFDHMNSQSIIAQACVSHFSKIA